jgi:predicted nuclease with TOPRIM domain
LQPLEGAVVSADLKAYRTLLTQPEDKVLKSHVIHFANHAIAELETEQSKLKANLVCCDADVRQGLQRIVELEAEQVGMDEMLAQARAEITGREGAYELADGLAKKLSALQAERENTDTRINAMKDEMAALRAEVERLQVCGNCANLHRDAYLGHVCRLDGVSGGPIEQCGSFFNPSRWAARS